MAIDLVDGFEKDDECIEFVRERGIPCIIGNHDRTCIKVNAPPVRSENRDFLRNLPATIEIDGVLIIHDNPLGRTRHLDGMWRQGSSILDHFGASIVLKEAKVFQSGPKIVVVGHSHIPAAFTLKEEIEVVPGRPITLTAGESCVLNPGSVGYSRVSDRTTNFATLDTESLEFCVHEIPALTALPKWSSLWEE